MRRCNTKGRRIRDPIHWISKMRSLLKRPSLVVFGMLAVAIGGVLAWTLSRGPRFSEEHCRLILVGMARSEVEQILGKPPNPTRRMNRISYNMTQFKSGLTQWLSRDGGIAIYFDSDNRVRAPWIPHPDHEAALFNPPRGETASIDPILDFFDDLRDWCRDRIP
jgi:hypothetical protein